MIYSDGLSEAENADGDFFDKKGLADAIKINSSLECHYCRCWTISPSSMFMADLQEHEKLPSSRW